MPTQTKLILAGAITAAMLAPLAVPASAASAGPAQQQTAPSANASAIEVLPARNLMNRPVQDPQGRDAGRIDGIILNTENGAVDFVILAGRGNFTLNGNVIAVPWPVFEPPTSGQGPLTIKVSADKLAQAPQLNPNMISALEQPRTRGNAFGYWGYPAWGWGYASWGYHGGPYGPYAAGRVPPGYGYGPGVPGYAGAAGWQSQGQHHQAQPELTSNGLFVSANGAISALESTATSSANAMRSAPVFASDYGAFGPRDNNGQIGNIREVMIDPRRGEVALVLIERGGFLGLQPRWYAVPPEALAWSPYQGGYDLTVNEQLLSTAPPVHPANNNPPNGPLQFPASQLAQLYQHFRINPYWEQGVAGSNPGNAAVLAGARSGSSQQPANSK